jgi:hypothetical protein
VGVGGTGVTVGITVWPGKEVSVGLTTVIVAVFIVWKERGVGLPPRQAATRVENINAVMGIKT